MCTLSKKDKSLAENKKKTNSWYCQNGIIPLTAGVPNWYSTTHSHIPDLQRLAGKVGESGDGSPQHSPGAFPSGDITREAKQFLQADSQF